MNAIEQLEQDMATDIPLGYEEFRLSTKGKLHGAPEVFHARNFDYKEMIALGSLTEKDMPIKLPSMVQKLIWEPDVHVESFKEAEFTEFLARFLACFYRGTIELPYKITEEDIDWTLKNVYAGDDKDPRFRDWLLATKSGQNAVNIEVDLSTLDFYDVEEAPDRIKYSKTYPSGKKFECEFTLPSFGDAAILARAVEDEFGERDKRYAVTYENFQKKREIEARRLRGENVSSTAIPYIPPSELEEVKKYELEKTDFTIDLTKGLYLASIDGKDVSDLKLSERVEIAKNDRRLDYNAFQMLSDGMKQVKIGIMPKITCRHPIKEVRTEMPYTFHTLDLFACLQYYQSDNSSIGFIQKDVK